MSLEALLVIAFGLGIGAVCKGVTGMGLPLLALPMLASYFELPHAIAVMMVPVTVTNAWQALAFRKRSDRIDFLPRMVVSGVIGIALGTLLLKSTPGPVLNIVFAVLLFAYVAMRLVKPSLSLSMEQTKRMSAPAIFCGGLLQGALGVAAPIMVTFFNAARFERHTYVHVIATVYFSLAVFQLASLTGAGLMRPDYLVQGLFALVPVAIFMPLGALLGRYISARAFDRLVLAILFVMAMRFMWKGVAGL